MLTYSLEDFNSDFSNDINDEVKSDISIDGYYCFYRTINENEESRLFPYRISNYYSSSFSQNEILCKVKPIDSDIIYEANIVFTFSSYGTSGTDYTLVVTPTDFKSAITEEVDSEGCNLKLSVSLYDYKNEKIDLPNSFECSWIGGNKLSPYVDVPLSSDTFGIQAITSGQNATLGKANFYGVLKTTLEVLVQENEEDAGRTVELSTVTPIPYSSGDYYIEGPDIIVYNSLGTDASYYKDKFKIFDKNTKKELTDVNWFMWYYKENGSATATAEDLKADNDYKLIYNFMPKLKEDNTLSVSNMFFDSNSGSSKNLYPLVVCKNYNGTILWAQPIYLMQNKYPSSMLNSWNGEFKIDEENGTIMSTMLGAGRKNTQNQFEGILMGDITGVPGGDTDAIGIGLYGYNGGAQSFRFGIDGKAFIGKAGHGRIKFDGTKGTITSASYEQNNGCGIKIDLDDGLIDVRGAKKSGTSYENKNSRILLQVLDPYFQITSEAGKKIIQIGSESYYLQSDNYESGKTGMKIDLETGKIDAYNLKVTSKNLTLDSSGGTNYFVVKDDSGNVLFNASSSNFYLRSSNYNTTNKTGMNINLQTGAISTGSGNFSISNTGILTASGATITGNATISGKITATELYANTKGEIAGWIINANQIRKGNIILDSSTGTISSSGTNGAFSINNQGGITATGGSIAGWTFNSNQFISPKEDLYLIAKTTYAGNSTEVNAEHAEIQLYNNGKIRCTGGSDIIVDGGTLDCRNSNIGSADDSDVITTNPDNNRLRGIVLNGGTSLRIFRKTNKDYDAPTGTEWGYEDMYGAKSIHFGCHLGTYTINGIKYSDPRLIKLFYTGYNGNVNDNNNYVTGKCEKVKIGDKTLVFIEGIYIGSDEEDYDKFVYVGK